MSVVDISMDGLTYLSVVRRSGIRDCVVGVDVAVEAEFARAPTENKLRNERCGLDIVSRNILPLAFALAVLKPNTELVASHRKLVAVGHCRGSTERRDALKVRNMVSRLLGLGGRKSADWLDLGTRAGHDIDWSAGAVSFQELGHAE
jgi:hypothetical protein